jgi:transposase-like protein
MAKSPHDAAIRKCFEAGMTQVETARHLGIGPNAPYRWSKRYNEVFEVDRTTPAILGGLAKARAANVDRHRMKWSPKIDALWNDASKTQKQIAAELGCNARTLVLAARREGKPHRGSDADLLNGLTPDQTKDAMTLRRAGYTLVESVKIATAPKTKIRFAKGKTG